MDAKNIRFIKTFIDYVDSKDAKFDFMEAAKVVEGSLPMKIESRTDLQWALCTNLLILKDLGGFKEIREIASIVAQIENASRFLYKFAEEVGNEKMGHSEVSNKSESELSGHIIRSFDHALIKNNLKSFKLALLNKINQHGGITEVARSAGLSQPSLSRLFNSDSVPRTSTVEAIYKVLSINSLEVPK